MGRKKPTVDRRDKGYRGDASQFFVAGELCRRGLVAVVTLGNCPNTDILVSDAGGKHFVHVQVKTFRPGDKTCSVGSKAQCDYGTNFFWVLSGIPDPGSERPFEFYIIPCDVMAKNVSDAHQLWLNTPGKKGQAHKESKLRVVYLPPWQSRNGWDIKEYLNRWDLIEQRLSIFAPSSA